MKKKFENITSIDDRNTFDEANLYVDALIVEATANGSLDEQYADNEYTREIGRVGGMCADFENKHIVFEHIKVKSPLVVSIENEMEKRHIKQRQTAELLEVKESTFSQIMTGKRPVSMRLAKRLYRTLNIDPGLILEFS
jgi:predicted XRE-type DNA-binding protein